MGDFFRVALEANEVTILSMLEKYGISLEIGSSLEAFSQKIANQPERHQSSPMFKDGCDEAYVENLCWFAGFDTSGELVHTQAIKLFDVGKIPFEAFLHSQIWNIFPYGYNPDYKVKNFYLSDEARSISGKITYHGELWLKETLRGGCLAVLLARLMLIKTLLKWSPDYFVGFQRPMSALRGLGAKESYARLEQRTLIMRNDLTDDLFEGWLVWMSRAEAAFNLGLPVAMLEELFEPDLRKWKRDAAEGEQSLKLANDM